MELDAYLRLNQAASGEWLHAIRDLLGCRASTAKSTGASRLSGLCRHSMPKPALSRY